MQESSLSELLARIEALYVPPEQGPAWNTVRAYRSDWADFSGWCESHRRAPLPAEPATLCRYLAAQAAAGVRLSTLRRRLSAIGQAHVAAGHPIPPTKHWAVREVMAAIGREHESPLKRKAALLIEDLRLIVRQLPHETRAGTRDRALLLLAFTGRLGASELVGLDCEDLEEVESGLRLIVRQARAGQGSRHVHVEAGTHPDTCPVTAVRAWRKVAEIGSGPLFRPVNRHDQVLASRLSPRSVALVVKRAVQRVGREAEHYAARSLRTGGLAFLEAGGTA